MAVPTFSQSVCGSNTACENGVELRAALLKLVRPEMPVYEEGEGGVGVAEFGLDAFYRPARSDHERRG